MLSPNVKSHFMAKSRAVKSYRSDCLRHIRPAKPYRWEKGRVAISIIYRASGETHAKNRMFPKECLYVPRDEHNAVAALKPMMDALVDAGVAPTDSTTWIVHEKFLLLTRWTFEGDGISLTVRQL